MRPNQPFSPEQVARVRLLSGIFLLAAAIGLESSLVASRMAEKGHRLTAIVVRSASPAAGSLAASSSAFIGAVAALLLLLSMNRRAVCLTRPVILPCRTSAPIANRAWAIQTRRSLTSVHFGGLYGP